MTNIWIRTIVGLVYFILCGFISARIRKKKGYDDPGEWFGMGVLFGIFTVLFVLLRPKNKDNTKTDL